MKDWIKEHETTLVTIGTAIGLWVAITSSFHREMDKFDVRLDKFEARMALVENRIIDLDKRLTSVETILLMQGYPTKSIALQENEKNK